MKSLIYFLIGLLLIGPLIIYRFEHPNKTETQLIIEIPDAYIELISKLLKSDT